MFDLSFFYADNIQLFVKISPKHATSALAQLNSCLSDVRDWMTTSKLKLNPEKLNLSFSVPISSAETLMRGNVLNPFDAVKNLGVIFDADFSFSAQVCNVCKDCFAQMQDFRRIRLG